VPLDRFEPDTRVVEGQIHPAQVFCDGWIWPLDGDAIATSVEKTGRAIIIHEAPRAGGVGAEIAAVINERCLYSLLKPIERVTGYDTP
jgi:pyruvate/2-oxoglutarate/acetoin dehydrogenase E1 component